ncbi:hypothetical protein [Clostridium botulinum]|uniref:hypothetical protein n=1 Tax=Clostridium botulinum TaxID=1491 RepID=UPI0003156969|nr:hypothetical protein [Clostridium botulinum]MBY6850369.1 hypothetical protein [Clostridium botulinum]MBY6857429.1 hypothetical protein [Clostridium botulinum]MBY6967399.1 hypothetical protein [Clostridium botulinum]HBJ1686151.1 hypothetical protein [Clostridium botulinum]
MIKEYEMKAIKSLLIKKGVLTENEIKQEYDNLLREKWDNDENDRMERHLYK